MLYSGHIPSWDTRKLRPAGAILKTFGGRASGPGPLEDLFRHVVSIFKSAVENSQRKLTSIQCHSIMTKIGDAVVAGGVRRCLPSYALIYTKEGLKKIKDITVEDYVATSKNRYQRVVATEKIGKRQVVEIITQIGKFESTPEHRWAVLNDLDGKIKWVEAKSIKTNDALIFIPRNIFGIKTNLPPYTYFKPEHSTTTVDINIPDLDEDIAWLIGNFHGDGYVYRKGRTCGEIMFACAPDMPKTVIKIINQLEKFGVQPVQSENRHDRAQRVRVKSNQLANYLFQFKQPNTSIDVPYFILEGTPDIRAAYIAGLFDADGSVKSQNGKTVRPIVASSIYPKYLRQVQTVLSSLGIISKLSKNRSAQGNWKAVYSLVTVGYESFLLFADVVGQFSEKWSNDADMKPRLVERKSLNVPRKLLRKYKYRSEVPNIYWTKNSKACMSFKSFTEKFGSRDYRPIRVLYTQEGKEKIVYDIQVENDECFIVDGLLTHNSAMLSLSNPSDDRMRNAKSGNWWEANPHFALANNSAAWTEKPDSEIFIEEWLALVKSKSGERGIFNREAAQKQASRAGRRDANYPYLVNPCSEIVLKDRQFCNLSSVTIRADDTKETLKRKVQLATILGTIQSLLTDFRYLSYKWKENTEEERLLGVSFCGIYDNAMMSTPGQELYATLEELRNLARKTNKEWAKKFDIPESTAITCVKPEGNSSQLRDSSSGIHPRYSKYYIRTNRGNKVDPVSQFLKDQGVPCEDDVTNPYVFVFSFPQEAPNGGRYRDSISALDQLDLWLAYNEWWCEHKPSITVYVRPHEWLEVGAFVYKHFDKMSGISFLPYTDHSYRQAPYQEITKEEYDKLVEKMPKMLDLSQLEKYETTDQTTSTREFACTGAQSCDLV